jgi:hypothetical protein
MAREACRTSDRSPEPDRLNQQVAQRLAFEPQLARDIKHLSTPMVRYPLAIQF